MGAVDCDAHAAQVELIGESALAEFDVATACVGHPPRLAQPGRFGAAHRLIEAGLDFGLDRIGQLGPAGGKELDPVIVERVVRSGDHHPGLQAQRAGQVGHRRGRNRPGEDDVDTRCGKPGLERGFEHVA